MPILRLLFLLQLPLASADSVICCGAERVFILDAQGKETWSWQASDSPQIPEAAHKLFRSTDECKPFGDMILITSSSAGVALIQREGKHCAFYTQARNAHSACLLPGMRVAVAASTGGDHLYIFNRRKSGLDIEPLHAISLKGAHGVLWDAPTAICWALGSTELLKLDRNMKVIETYPLPRAGGHDLSRDDADQFFISTNTEVLRFNPAKETFMPMPKFASLKKIKSIDRHPKTQALLWQQAVEDHWWGHQLNFSDRDAIKLPGERLYKLRWDVPRPTPEMETADALKTLGAQVFQADGHVKEVVANGLKVQDDDLHLIGWLPYLTDVSLEQTGIGDEGFQHLAGLSRLEWLNLWQTKVGDESLERIGKMKNLQHLPIGGTRITDAGLKHLAGLKDLVYLGLRDTMVTDAGIAAIVPLTQLESLNLMNTQVSDASVPNLMALKQLKTLRLEGSRVSQEGVGKLRAALPGCVVVWE